MGAWCPVVDSAFSSRTCSRITPSVPGMSSGSYQLVGNELKQIVLTVLAMYLCVSRIRSPVFDDVLEVNWDRI